MDDKVVEGWLTDTKVFKELALKVVGRVIDGYVNPTVLTPKFQSYWAQAALAAGDTGVLAAVWLEISTVLTPELVAKLIYAIVQAILKNV
jgi:hypothetical protein